MEREPLPDDFREFLKLLNEAKVEYLLVGGLAVGFHGYPRTTGDLDVWVAVSPLNASRLVEAFHRFGMRDPEITPELFQQEGKIIRMGAEPIRIEVQTQISGVDFAECFARRVSGLLDGERVNVISLGDLKRNKKAAGRHKDLDDLEHLPPG